MNTMPVESLLEMLRAIGKRPMMYIGDPWKNRISIWHLQSFYVGFQSGRVSNIEGDDVLDALVFWLCTRFRVNIGPLNWAGHLVQYCNGDDEAAFRLFYDVFEEYIADRAQVGAAEIKRKHMDVAKHF